MSVRVVRGRGETIAADRTGTARLLELAGDGETAVRVWRPHRQVAFGRRDASREGYGNARKAARARDFRPVERRVGGRAVAYDGETTLAFARAEPVASFREGIQERFDRLTDAMVDAVEALGVAVEHGEPDNSFCPGAHSLRLVDGGKVAGIAQRVKNDRALVAGVLVVDRRGVLGRVLADVYDALAVPFDPDSVGSLVAGGGPSRPTAVRRAVEEALVGEAEARYDRFGGSFDPETPA